jgi:hypothetical protein
MARNQPVKPPINDATIGLALAKAVANGDIVTLHQIFGPVSPLRAESPENVYTGKYDYFLPTPEEENSPLFKNALDIARHEDVAKHARLQLASKGPAQLHAALVLPLADNAVRLGKYSSAAQAYELLRIRPRMREAFFAQADSLLDAGDIAGAVRGYRIAVGLDYNYAAFPEPLPSVPDYQSRALLLHADYPTGPENCLALRAPAEFLPAAMAFLMRDKIAAARLEDRPQEVAVQFLAAWVRTIDPEWDTFARRYVEACALVADFGRRLQRKANRDEGVNEELEDEIVEQQEARDPRAIPEKLLGWAIEDGAWWQYLRELAFAHPAAALFVTRQAVSTDLEIIMPRFREDNPLLVPLGLEPAKAAKT